LVQKKSQYLSAAATAWPASNESAAAASQIAPSSIETQPQVASIIPLMELERRAIINALDYTKGDRAVAAHLLGIGRTTLYRKLKEYQLAG
jgi:transcriptional regulator of acetoin/glycerol metabolism